MTGDGLRDAIETVNEKLATIEEAVADDVDLGRLTPPEGETIDAAEWSRNNTEPAVKRIERLERTPDTDAFTNVANTIESINPEIREIDREVHERFG